jgi:phosphoribosylformimino-5-aminoimidazole carboxamide ribotide isomerase
MPPIPVIELYPAIDLRGGRCVRLRQGEADRETRYPVAPPEVAAAYAEAGARWIHVVDLDAAFGTGSNREVVAGIARTSPLRVQTGGGLRSLADLEAVLGGGVHRAVLGTAAVRSPELVADAVARWGADRIAVGLDAREGEVAVRGWTEGSGRSVLEVGRDMRDAGVATLIYTDIARDGMGTGPDVEGSLQLHRETGLEVIVSGGIGTAEHLRAVRDAGPGIGGVIVGRALYEGDLDVEAALAALR